MGILDEVGCEVALLFSEVDQLFIDRLVESGCSGKNPEVFPVWGSYQGRAVAQVQIQNPVIAFFGRRAPTGKELGGPVIKYHV